MKPPTLDDHAFALMQSALERIPEARWSEAAAALEQAAALHEQAGRDYDGARCLQLAATMRRSAGDLDEAAALIDQAQAIAFEDQPLAVSVDAEAAETALAQDRCQDAIESWTRAIDNGRKAGLTAGSLSALLRRRAFTYLALSEFDSANRDFDEVHYLLQSAGDKNAAGFARLEQVRLLWQHGELERAGQALSDFQKAAGEPWDAHLKSEWLLQRSRLARAAGKLDSALEFARRSCEAAREAVAPLSYFGASAALAETLQAKGDFAGAYGALATAWATLSDLLGKETASTWIEPCLMAFQVQWGNEVFAKAKLDYETKRRAELQRK
jgi:tetratricopeptide (TPR) repeat protein